MHPMKNLKSFIFLPVLGWLLVLIACGEDEVLPNLPTLTPAQQLAFLVENDTLDYQSTSISGTDYYFRVVDSIFGNVRTLDSGAVIYFHYSLSFLSASLDSLFEGTDSVRVDTVAENPIVFQSFDFTQRSLVGKLGSDAFWPVGLDQVLQNSAIKEGETYLFYLPPALAYENIQLTELINNKPVEIGIHLDSIRSVEEVLNQASVDMIRYISDAELRDTAVVAGGPLTILPGNSGNPIYFKRLSPVVAGLSPLRQDSVTITFNYRFVTDSLTGGGLGALENISGTYSFLVDGFSTVQGIQTGVQSMRVGERAFMMFGPQLAYNEAICFVPDLRSSANFYGDRAGNTTNRVKQYLLDNKIVPGYAFQTEPYRSYIFEVTLDQVY